MNIHSTNFIIETCILLLNMSTSMRPQKIIGIVFKNLYSMNHIPNIYVFIFILGGTSSKERLERLLGVFEGHHLAVLSL